MLNIPKRVSAIVAFVILFLVASPTFSPQTFSQGSNLQKPSISTGTKTKSKTIQTEIVASADTRSIRLRSYLQAKNSPMSASARSFIEVADKYGLDWKMLPAISGVESTFGQFIPVGSYNAYGWNNGKYYFSNWADATNQVGKGINEKWGYMGKITPSKIGRYYAANPSWASKVNFYMDQIENFK